jgi:hypothetical protein
MRTLLILLIFSAQAFAENNFKRKEIWTAWHWTEIPSALETSFFPYGMKNLKQQELPKEWTVVKKRADGRAIQIKFDGKYDLGDGTTWVSLGHMDFFYSKLGSLETISLPAVEPSVTIVDSKGNVLKKMHEEDTVSDIKMRGNELSWKFNWVTYLDSYGGPQLRRYFHEGKQRVTIKDGMFDAFSLDGESYFVYNEDGVSNVFVVPKTNIKMHFEGKCRRSLVENLPFVFRTYDLATSQLKSETKGVLTQTVSRLDLTFANGDQLGTDIPACAP